MGNEITGNLGTAKVRNIHIASDAGIDPSKLAIRSFAESNFPLELCRVWDAMHTNLPGTAANDDLALVTGTLGTDAPTIQSGDVKAIGATTRYLGANIPVPYNYVSGDSIRLRLRADMKTTVADTSATIDVEAYRNTGDGATSSDLCTTAAQSINSLDEDDYDFNITGDDFEPGESIFVRIAIAVNDAATATEVIGRLIAIKPHFDRRG